MVIRRVRKKRNRIYWTIRHRAASDFILRGANENPYRKGTPEHDEYNTQFDQIATVIITGRELEAQIRRESGQGETVPPVQGQTRNQQKKIQGRPRPPLVPRMPR